MRRGDAVLRGGGRVRAPSLSPQAGPPRPRAEPPRQPLCDLGPARTLSEPPGAQRWRAAAAGEAPRRRAPGPLVGRRGSVDASSAVLGAGPPRRSAPRALRGDPGPGRRPHPSTPTAALPGSCGHLPPACEARPHLGGPQAAAAGPRGLEGDPSGTLCLETAGLRLPREAAVPWPLTEGPPPPAQAPGRGASLASHWRTPRSGWRGAQEDTVCLRFIKLFTLCLPSDKLGRPGLNAGRQTHLEGC